MVKAEIPAPQAYQLPPLGQNPGSDPAVTTPGSFARRGQVGTEPVHLGAEPGQVIGVGGRAVEADDFPERRDRSFHRRTGFAGRRTIRRSRVRTTAEGHR